MKSITLQDIQRLSFQNQFSVSAADFATKLADPDKNKGRVYYIMAVVAVGAWTLTGQTGNSDPELRPVVYSGTGNTEFHHFRCMQDLTGQTGISEIHGFWANASQY